MGFLSAFARGAAGPGLLQVAQMQQREQELAAAAGLREKEREEERQFRLQLAREGQAGREDLALLRAELRGTGGTRSRSGSGGDDGAGSEDAAVYELMRKTGASGTEARGMLRSAMDGANPYSRRTAKPQQIDDGDRMRTVTTETDEPDVERFRQLNRMVATALIEGPSNMKANPEQRAKGRQTDVETDAAIAYGKGDMGAGKTGLLLRGKGEFGASGSSELTGAAAPGSVAASQIRENDAQAGKARADAPSADVLAKLPPMVKEELKNLDAREKEIASAIVKVQAAGEWNPETNPGQKQLQAALAATRLKRGAIVRQYMPQDKGAKGGADPLGLGLGDEKPAAAPAPAAKPAPKADDKPSPMLRAVGDKINEARAEGSEYQRIYARWREAGAGGPPLTPEEKATARRFGLAVRG